ncbi:B-cell lymphoma 3 protein-like protein [Frankliniella fusca]|uniref:B-cell lymphoma 3 protein-like protein n=1 Tax=Frankliniella fusca TaxID=407009 RepID=A0AAE1L5E1_9NEOP|nr:B-cell lymphoma 3 protein-like protein [Frankliniella fusca]
MPTFALKAGNSVVEKNCKVENMILKVEHPSQSVLAEAPQKAQSIGPVVTQKGSPLKNGSTAETESKSNEMNGLGIRKQLTSNGTGASDAALSTRTIQLGTWGKIPIVVRKARKPEENGKELHKPLATEQLQKKMKLSTVPKVVPLINTVGNQSKLIPFTLPSTSQASPSTPTTATNSSVPQSQSKLVQKDSSKPMSILEATLTSAPKDSILNGASKSKSDFSLSSSLPVGSSDDQLLKTDNDLEKGINPSIAIPKPFRIPKCVISYEKGVTRLVAVERRTVTMVDASVQVSIPQFDAESQGTQVNHYAVSSESGSIQPQTTSTLPLHQKPFVVLDSNGRKVLAIPKLILNNYGGAKKFVIEGKGIKRKAETPIENLLQNDFHGTALPTSVIISQAEQPPLTLPNSTASKPIAGKTVSDLTADASLSFETLTTSSCRTLPSISTSQQNSSISSESTGTGSCVAFPKLPNLNSNSDTLSRPPTVLLSHTPSVSHVITSDSLVLPLDSPVHFESHTSSSLPQTICVPSSTKIQSLHNNSESIILPLNSPIGAQPLNSDGTSMGVFHVLMPNLINNTNGKHHVEHENQGLAYPHILKVVDQVAASTKPQTKLANISSQPIVQKKGLANSCSLINQNNSNFGSVTGEEVMGGKAVSSSNATPSKSDIENFVKAAFIDFKQCFTFNKDGQLPVHAAIECNDIAALKRQCIVLKARKASVDIKNAHDETPLQLALYFGHTPCIKLLLEHGANCRFFDQDGNSPLHLAILYANDALKYLLVPGRFPKSFINYLNDEGFSPLHLAAQGDKVEAISLLIKCGADIDLPDGKSGRTALFHAVERKNYKSQQILEKHGANIKEPTFTGATPFSMTRTDAIAQLASGQNTFGEIIDSDTLLKPRRLRIGKVK